MKSHQAATIVTVNHTFNDIKYYGNHDARDYFDNV